MGQTSEKHPGHQPQVRTSQQIQTEIIIFFSVVSRVTKFKINWDSNSTENSENIPPKTDPNQMSSENSQSLEGPLKSGGQTSGLQAAERMEMD